MSKTNNLENDNPLGESNLQNAVKIDCGEVITISTKHLENLLEGNLEETVENVEPSGEATYNTNQISISSFRISHS